MEVVDNTIDSDVDNIELEVPEHEAGINIFHENLFFSGIDSKISKLFRIYKKNLKTDYSRFFILSQKQM